MTAEPFVFSMRTRQPLPVNWITCISNAIDSSNIASREVGDRYYRPSTMINGLPLEQSRIFSSHHPKPVAPVRDSLVAPQSLRRPLRKKQPPSERPSKAVMPQMERSHRVTADPSRIGTGCWEMDRIRTLDRRALGMSDAQ